MSKKFTYGEMSWPEIREVAKEGRIAVIPVATIEDHGPHLPVDTDVVLCNEVCRRAVERIPDEGLLIPSVIHGYSPHHMDFPGPITIGPQTFTHYVLDICKSLIHHGFLKILIVNGHGSNVALLEMVARLAIIETQGKCLCASLSYWNVTKLREVAARVMTSGESAPGHAGEFETSLYLAINPDLVEMAKAVREVPAPGAGLGLGRGSTFGTGASLWPFWSSFSQTGIMGDASQGTVEKGVQMLEAAADGLADLIREMKARPIPERVDHH